MYCDCDNDDFPVDAEPGTQFIVCLEFKSGKGEVSCWTDTFMSESQPSRITLDADYMRRLTFFKFFLNL